MNLVRFPFLVLLNNPSSIFGICEISTLVELPGCGVVLFRFFLVAEFAFQVFFFLNRSSPVSSTLKILVDFLCAELTLLDSFVANAIFLGFLPDELTLLDFFVAEVISWYPEF